MRTAVLVVVFALIGGCVSSVDELFLTPSEAEALSENFDASLQAQQLVSEWVFAASRGDVDLALDFPGHDYVAPSASNGFVGSLTITDGQFPFGAGDLTLTFTARDETGAAVDPYSVDLSDDSSVTIEADVAFVGTTLLGLPLTADGVFTMATTANGPDVATTTVTGDFDIDHDGYAADLMANGLSMTLDLAGETVTNVTGSVNGVVDIPEFEFDAAFTLIGLGDTFDVAIDAAATQLRYSFDLLDL